MAGDLGVFKAGVVRSVDAFKAGVVRGVGCAC
jgi:hypothetical protein